MTSAESKFSGDDLVLTGLSGRLPESDTIEQFAEQLFAGVNLVTADDRRWPQGLFGVNDYNGKIKDLSYFDATFFGVHPKQADRMAPQLRMLLEATYEAIVDAGFSPTELRGTRTGVFVGVTFSEAYNAWCDGDPDKYNGYAVIGCTFTMYSKRISHSFDFKGPSTSGDNACASSLYAMTEAVDSIRAGHCDRAIVGATNLCLDPRTSLHFRRLNMLSREGRCATFDVGADGYVRSEAVVAVFLQRRSEARRVYATVRGARCNNDGYKEEGITFPSGDMQRQLAQETLQAAGLRPQDVVYFETHGTGTKVGDPSEVNAIAELFCKDRDRQKPLLIGSVKTNMGHAETAAGLCSIVKVVLAMQRGVIPGNLHFKVPNPDIPALIDGRLQVVTRNTPWDGGLVAVNAFGVGGANSHVILESEQSSPAAAAAGEGGAGLPRLVLASGRTEEAVRALLQHAQAHRDSAALHALLDAVHALPIPGHAHRGYRLLTDPPQEEILEIEDSNSGEARPVWFVFSGMGSQWPEMARSLLALPVFADSIARSAQVLKPHGVDLYHVLTVADENVINTFVSITSVQVALVDVLREVGITPDGIIGFSFGEIGSAYADGALTAQQAVLCAYWRGRSVLDAALPPGAMLAVGLSWEQAKQCCPPDVELACHLDKDSVTVSGPLQSIEKFSVKLTAKNIFARRVSSCGVAFHSKYVAAAAPPLRARLETVIPHPRPRSARWVSTSLPEGQWGSQLGQLCSAEYLVNNLVSPVRLARALAAVPACAAVVEVAPHALLAAVLRRALPHAAHAPLLRRHAADATQHLLAALGKLYAAGCQPRVARLYPPVPWPVPRGTPDLASHVRWDRTHRWDTAKYTGMQSSGEIVIECDLSCEEDAFIAGYDIDGRTLFPASGYLMLVWRTMAKLRNKKIEETCVVLENVQFKRATIVSREQPVRFLVSILEGSGEFEVCEGGGVAVSGVVRLTDERATERLAPADLPASPAPSDADADQLPLDTNDVYKELHLRGYNYSGIFRGIRASNSDGSAGQLAWEDNWISFMDTMFQFSTIGMDTSELYLLTRVLRVVIDPIAQAEALMTADGSLPVQMYRDINVVRAGGVEMRGINMSLAPRCHKMESEPKLDKYIFVPYDNVSDGTKEMSRSHRDAFSVSLQLALDSVGSLQVKVMEAAQGRAPGALLLPLALQLLEREPLVSVEPVLLVTGSAAASNATLQELGIKVTTKETGCHLVLAEDVMAEGARALPALAGALAARGVLLLRERLGALDGRAAATAAAAGLALLSRQVAENREYVLLGRKATLPKTRVVLEVADDGAYAWLPQLQVAMQQADANDSRLYLWSREQHSGILGLASCLRGEVGGHALRVFHVPGARAAFAPDAPEYAPQVQKDLAVNVLRAGVWGSYRYLPFSASSLLQAEHAYVNTVTRGDLSSLRWIESELRHVAEQPLPAGSALCRVHYASLNFHDVMVATGKLPSDALPGRLASQECALGLEFSGQSSGGARVMGMVAARGLATSVLCDEAFLWRAPDAWSLEEAATVPVAYATAYYALAVRGRMRRGEAVLVHAGAGGVGQAAIAIALHAGCTVFTTAGTPAKRAFLLARFPALRPENVGNSRDTSFEQLVMRRTRGRGVDLVLNSLAHDKLLASVRCLAEGGRFLELGKLDISDNAPLGMSVFFRNTTFHGILLAALFDDTADDADRAAVVRCINDGIASGAVRPLPATVFTNQQLEQAFRYLAGGKNIGKVVVRVVDGSEGAAKPVSAVPRTYMRAHKSYVLVGGLGGFGLELGSWLVARGARHLVLVSRSGVRSGYQARCVRRWRQAGARVLLSAADASSPQGARQLLHTAAHQLAPVAAIFNLAAVLRDRYFENQTEDDFRAVAEPKIDVTRALDVASRELAPELEYFVVFSSVACGRGNPGQSNCGLANSAMERVMEQRRADGLPGLAIQWGPIGELLGPDESRHGGGGQELPTGAGAGAGAGAGGAVPQSVASCLQVLETLLASPHAVVASMVVPEKCRQNRPATQDIVQAVANVIGIKDPSATPQTATLVQLGMDSLMGTEIQNTLQRALNVSLSPRDVRALTFARLSELASGHDARGSATDDATTSMNRREGQSERTRV